MPVDVESATTTCPDRISVSGTLWNLEASPAALREAAGVLRARAVRAGAAQTTVDRSVRSLVANQDWEGDSADVYLRHSLSLTTDLGELESRLEAVAGALEQVAAVLVSSQSLLDHEWATLASVPRRTSSGSIWFDPADEAQATRVRSAVAAAVDIRAHVDEALVLKESAFGRAGRSFATISDTWQPRVVRVLDLNVGQGFGNVPWPFKGREDGTDHGDIDEIGQIIAGNGANVVTLQEVFEGDLHKLGEWLEDNTAASWDVHFAAASDKMQWSDAVLGGGSVNPFGNAVLVRHGDGIAGSDELAEVTLQQPGGGPVEGTEGRSMEGARIHFDG